MTSPAATVLVSADGADWRDVSAPVYWVNVEDDDRLTDKVVVRFEDTTGLLADASFEGLEVRIALGDNDNRTYVFEGAVTGARVSAAPTRQRVELTALDFTSRLSAHDYDPTEWRPGETLSSVLTRIISRPDNDIVAFQIDPAVDITLDKRRTAPQANVNQWEFVLDQAQRQACLAFCEFDGRDASNFYFVPIAKVLAAEPVGTLHYGRDSGNLIDFRYERSAVTAVPLRSATTIDPVTGTARSTPPPPTTPRPALPAPMTDRVADLDAGRRAAIDALADLAAVAAAKLTQPTERVSGQAARTADELAHSDLTDPTCTLGYHGRGIAVGDVALRAKSRVQISGIAGWAEGDWYVRRVNHIFSRAEGPSHTPYSCEFLVTR